MFVNEGLKVPAPQDAKAVIDFLRLAAFQVESALRDTQSPVEELGSIVAGMGDTTATERAARALQFHDRLTQRLTHVRDTLAELASVIEGASTENTAASWDSFRERIRSGYSMEQERALFDLLLGRLSGAQTQGALGKLNADSVGAIELF